MQLAQRSQSRLPRSPSPARVYFSLTRGLIDGQTISNGVARASWDYRLKAGLPNSSFASTLRTACASAIRSIIEPGCEVPRARHGTVAFHPRPTYSPRHPNPPTAALSTRRHLPHANRCAEIVMRRSRARMEARVVIMARKLTSKTHRPGLAHDDYNRAAHSPSAAAHGQAPHSRTPIL
jgi:hypothetical protein